MSGHLCGRGKRLLRGKADVLVQRLVDSWMAIPTLLLLLNVMAVLGPGLLNVILALGVVSAARSSRTIRSSALVIKENQFVEAARAVGASHLRIILRYILPNIMAPIIIIATISLGVAILAESTLSFLGLGVPPPYPSWGDAEWLGTLVHAQSPVDGHLAGRGHQSGCVWVQYAGGCAAGSARPTATGRTPGAALVLRTGAAHG